MKLVKYLIILFFLLLSIAAHADEKITTAKVKELATSNSENASYLSKDGKVRYSVEHVITEDGKVEMRAKKQYLPAITDGINRDKTSKFRIPASAKKTAKWFAKGANYAVFLSMIIDVLGEGVDYVLDPKNNSVQYKTSGTYNVGGFESNSAQEACEMWLSYKNNREPGFADSVRADKSHCRVYGGKYKFDGNIAASIQKKQQQETKVMNDEEFAQAVIELAKADNAKAKKVMIDVAKQAVSDGDYDKEIQKAVDELNADETKDDTQDNQDNTSDSSNASSSDSTNTDSQDDTQATPKNQNETDNNGGKEKDKFELPGFCDWATKVCEFIDWVKKEPELPEPQQVQIDDNQLTKTAQSFDTDYLRFGGQCPAPISHTIAVGNQHSVFTIDLTPLCQFVLLVRPAILAMAYLLAIGIVSNAIKDS